jgi:hypothetical protein
MAYVIQQPNSSTNDSDKYRVVDIEEWCRYINGATPFYTFLTAEDFTQAQLIQDRMNTPASLY